MKRTTILLYCLMAGFAAMAQKQPPIDKRLAGLDTAIARYLQDWHGAGCAVAVVEKNKVLLAKGFGFRDYEKKLPVTENTLFAIGSSTKAFTASLLGMLVKEGKLDLDKPVHDYLPELVFYNEHLTNHVTPRDMMTHRTGLPRHDYAWYGSTTPRDSLLYRIRFLEPSTELRQSWQYNNFMFLAQGMLAEKLYGKTWEALIKEKIFEPLNMPQSNFSITDLQKGVDHAKGYKTENDSVKTMDYMNIDAIGPAGSINSNAGEMANWVLTWVNNGKFNGKEVIPASYVSQAIAAQVAMGSGSPSKEMPDVFGVSYGLGWMINTYRGHYMVQHGGNIDGFSANVAFFPSDSIGVVVLTNQHGSALPGIICQVIADRLLGLSYRNWNKIQLEAFKKATLPRNIKPTSDSSTHKYNTKPSHPLADYTGVFNNPGYGSAGIELRNDTLWIHYNNNKGTAFLHHYHYDVFSVRSTDDKEPNDNTKLRFITTERGDIGSFETHLEPSIKDIVFTRQAPSIAMKKSDLEKYVGEYVLGGMTAKIYIRGENTLMLLVPGQPDYELVPVKKDEFDLKVVKGYSVRFEVNDKNEVTAVNFVQPNGTFKATRKK
jgi:CubicO group peptidase (beta-lactamase class C family)